jgi:predicted  nucleic acid-binding Zn-ribbon protein
LSREKLVALEKLQAIDLQIEALSKEADAGPTRVGQVEALVAKARAAADLERGKVADNERARRHLEAQLADETEKVKKWESRLPQLKHPREFAALEREITGTKKANEAAEEELTKLKADFDPLKAVVKEKEGELAARQSELNKEQKSVRAGEGGLRSQIETLQAERDRQKPLIDAKLYAAYESIRKKKGGKVFVPLNAGGACGGCHRKLAPQTVNRLLATGTFDVCPACLRLVYTPAAPPEAK